MTQTKQLKEIFEIAKGKKVKIINQKTAKSVPYLLIDTLRGKEPEFFTEDEKITEANEKDILMVFDGANSGLVGTGLKGAVGSTIARLRSKIGVNTDYITYFLSLNFSNLNQDIKGSAIPHVKPKKLLELNIFLPPLPEQSLIVSAIETQFTRLDESVKNLKNVKKKLEIYRKAVLKKAFEKKEGWEEKRLKELCEVISGSTPKTEIKEYWDGEVCWITPKDLSGYKNKYINKTIRTITKEGYKSCSTTLIPENNVLMSSRAPIGYLVINKVPMCTNQGFKSFKINDKSILNEEFLYYYLKSIVESIKKAGSGTTFNELSKPKAEKIIIYFPKSLPDQQLIVSQIESKFSIIDKVEEAVESALKKAEMLRKSILKSAFEGKLVKMETEKEEVRA